MKKRTRKQTVDRIRIPLYKHTIVLVVFTERIYPGPGLPHKLIADLTDGKAGDDLWGRACQRGNRIYLLLNRNALNNEVVAHEIFHVTHMLMDYIGETLDENHHEPCAYLNGWLTQQVYTLLRKHGYTIKS